MWDYDKKPWESASRTPAFEAIYDVISQQQLKKAKLENVQLINDPPRKILSDHRNTIDFGPQGLNYIDKADWNFSPEMIDVVGDVRLTVEELEKNAESIKRWFHTNKFLKFNDLTSTLRQQPTATQILRMAAEIAVQLNPAIGTYTGGFLRSVDERVTGIEARAGRGPFAPDIMANIEDIVMSNSRKEPEAISIVPVFTGPLAREQKTQQELDPIMTGLAALTPLFAEYPDLKYALRAYGTAEDILKAVNFPLKNFVPEEEWNQIVADLNAARAALQEQQQALEMAKVSKDISGPVDETSILGAAAGVAG